MSRSPLDAIGFLTKVREGVSVAATPERPTCGMYVFLDRPRLLGDLQGFLQGRGFIAAQRRGDGLDVSIPGDSDMAQARRVVSVYLTVWQAVHPGVQASIVENDRAPRTFSCQL